MNLQQLDHFLAVVETQSFSRAADKLHLTQPALSRSIQALEEELGGPLLERGKNKTLTAPVSYTHLTLPTSDLV